LTAYSKKYGRVCGRKAWVISKQELAKLYSSKSITQIAKEYSVSTASVWKALQRHYIVIRSKSDGLKNNWELHRSHKPEDQPNYKNGSFNDGKGYIRVLCPNHPHAIKYNGKPKYVLEHVLVWEKANNKPLLKGYIIHHLNGVRSDNRPENLVAVSSKKDHSTWTLTSLLEKRVRELDPNAKLLDFKKRNTDKVYCQGYVIVSNPQHHRAMVSGGKKRYVLEHILNWEKANNAIAPKGSIIHHLNGIKDDNRPENLTLLPSRHEHDTGTIIKLLRNRIIELEKVRGYN
jgi:hypothetical protein